MDQQDMANQVESLRRDLADLTQKLSSYVERDGAALGDAMSRGARYARRALNQKLAAASEQTGQLADSARAQANDLQEAVEAYVVENPIRAIAIAAGVGLLLGAMGRR